MKSGLCLLSMFLYASALRASESLPLFRSLSAGAIPRCESASLPAPQEVVPHRRYVTSHELQNVCAHVDQTLWHIVTLSAADKERQEALEERITTLEQVIEEHEALIEYQRTLLQLITQELSDAQQ